MSRELLKCPKCSSFLKERSYWINGTIAKTCYACVICDEDVFVQERPSFSVERVMFLLKQHLYKLDSRYYPGDIENVAKKIVEEAAKSSRFIT